MALLDTREFAVTDTHGFQDIDNFAVRKTSDGLGWAHGFVSVQEEGPHEGYFCARRDLLICVVNHGILRGHLSINGKLHQLDGGPGTIAIIPSGVAFGTKLETTISSTHLYLRRELIDEVASKLYGEDTARVDIPLCAAKYDPVLEHLCHAVRQTLDDPHDANCAPYIDHLLKAIVAYLLRNHPTREPDPCESNGKLSDKQLRQVSELIESRIGDRLVLADIACHFGFSTDHFGRLFKNKTGLTLYQFVIRCRIDRARHLLSESDMPIAMIAQDCGFADQVHLTRAMRRQTGVTPAAYRKRMAA